MIGKRENATKIRKVGGRAFPNDYNWTCPVCGNENRKWEPTCQACEWEATNRV